MLVYTKETVSAGTPTLYSRAGRIRGRNLLSWSQFWTSTLAGTLTLWCSDKENPDESTDADWVQVTDVTPTSPTGGGGGKSGQTIGNAGHLWYRFKLVVSAGTGNWETFVNHVSAWS